MLCGRYWPGMRSLMGRPKTGESLVLVCFCTEFLESVNVE